MSVPVKIGLAVDDPADGLAWALAASDHLS